MRVSDKSKGYGSKSESDSTHDDMCMYLSDRIESNSTGIVEMMCDFYGEPNYVLNKTDVLWEQPVKISNGKPAGFIDLFFRAEFTHPTELTGGEYEDKDKPKLLSRKNVFIEVKTKLNYGESIRQLNYYANLVTDYRNSLFYVFCFECRRPDIFFFYNIGVVSLENNEIHSPDGNFSHF